MNIQKDVLPCCHCGEAQPACFSSIVIPPLPAAAVDDSSTSSKRPIRPPAIRCVAAANGWVIAAVDCPPLVPTSSNPPLRLVSRWNVRRGTTTSSSSPSSAADSLIPLPPPVCVGTDPSIVSASAIAHVFVDPTGCHVLLSAYNGEAYYLHSTSQKPRKLTGFGPEPDGTPSCRTGKGAPAGTVSGQQQLGLTNGSYVTAVAWDKVRGTEGSTKKILLGTSLGEIYEYSLVSPVLDGSSSESDGQTDADLFPALVHRFGFSDVSGSGDRMGNTNRDIVSGIHFECPRRFPNYPLGEGSSPTDSSYLEITILAVTCGIGKRTRLHTYTLCSNRAEIMPSSSSSSSTFVPAFSGDESHSSFVELPGSVAFADLRVCGDDFSVKTETGLFYGSISSSSSGNMSTGGKAESGLLPYDDVYLPAKGPRSLPKSTALTPNHFILLNDANQVHFVDRVAKKVVQKERLDWVSLGKMGGDRHVTSGAEEIVMDSRRPDQVWLRKSVSLVHISSSCEARDVWMYKLQQCLDEGAIDQHSLRSGATNPQLDAQFERASTLCSNKWQKATVAAARAEFYKLAGRIDLSSRYMAECPPALLPFDRTATYLSLQRLRMDFPREPSLTPRSQDTLGRSSKGLLTYLTDKMRLSKVKDDEVAYSMYSAWCAELHLNERSRRSGRFDSFKKVRGEDGVSCSSWLRHDIDAAELPESVMAFCDVSTAVDAALYSYRGKDGALNAIRVLNESSFELAEPCYYKFASALLARAPMEAAMSFLAKYGEGLCPSKLLPAFMQYDFRRKESRRSEELLLLKQEKWNPKSALHNSVDDSETQTDSLVDDENAQVKYLEGVIRLGCQSTAVFNYLVRLYSAMEDEAPLYRFLSEHMATSRTRKTDINSRRARGRKSSSPLDMTYTLRTILKTGRHFRSAVMLYIGFGMRQKAVELAIMVDPTVARELTRDRVDAEEQRRLWLMIARNAAEGGGDGKDMVASVASVLKDCGPDILCIEDVLPFLPDFAQIDQIQSDICLALTSYSSKIETYMKEMAESERMCQDLREEIYRMETSSINVVNAALCSNGSKPTGGNAEALYVFPSGYVYVQSVLMELVKPYLNEQQSMRIESILNKIELQRKKDGSSLSEVDSHSVETMQSELNGLIAAECPLTGAFMVKSVDRVFSDDDEAYC